MNNGNQDDWGNQTEHHLGDADWSTPQHQPPQPDQYPGPRRGGPPTGGGGTNLETSEILAIVVTFFIPGVGQMMLGQTVKGLVILGAAIFTGCGLGLVSIASVLDAYLVVMAKKRREVGEWEFFPDFDDAFNQRK